MKRFMSIIPIFVGVLITPTIAKAEAHWVTDPRAVAADVAQAPVALQFRRIFSLRQKPSIFRVSVSADQRFVLYVNEQRVGTGPARGDLKHWRYETFDLAPYLRRGGNIVAVQVWSDAKLAALAQISSGHTALWMSAENPEYSGFIDSDKAWQVRVDQARTVEPAMPQLTKAVGSTFYVAGPPESIDGRLQPTDWMKSVTRSSGWNAAVILPNEDSNWVLVADQLPPMRYQRVSSGRVVRSDNIIAASFPHHSVTVPANSEVAILIDAGRILSAYPVLVVSGGKGSEVKASYVESLYDPNAHSSDPNTRVRYRDRSTVDNGLALGLTDTFTPRGDKRHRFFPYWWRTWRFVELHIKTTKQPLILNDFETWETGYPFVQRGYFKSSDPELNDLWNIGWHTALVDAHETYMDSSYWEQLQYIGDTRIQMLLSYAIAGDSRLAMQALDAFDQSRGDTGFPRSAWPNSRYQIIPPFGLLWIGSLHDYWMRQPGITVVQHAILGTRAALDEFTQHLKPSGLIGLMPGWQFVDWKPMLDGGGDVPSVPGDEAEREKRSPSCVVTMQYVGALREAADLERAAGKAARADEYLQLADKSQRGINEQCWDENRGLYADTPEKKTFSQHATLLAVLYDIAPNEQHRNLIDKITIRYHGIDAPEGITGTSYYFSFYLGRALEHAGLADRYPELLNSWRDLLRLHFSTWPEVPDPSRSDTHAWSAHPTVGLMEYVAGIKSAAPGYERVSIEPHLGSLTTLDCAVAHHKGLIEVKYTVQNGKLSALITLPDGLAGEFRWNGQSRTLLSGKNEIEL